MSFCPRCFRAVHCILQQVRVVASLPCYSPANVDSQRGSGVFQRSIQGLQMLNAAGYGQAGSGLQLDLVYNPNGAFLAPAQATLEVIMPRDPATMALGGSHFTPMPRH